MAVPTPPRSLKFGVIVEKTLEVIEQCKVPIAIFVAVMTVVNGAVTWFSLSRTSMTDQAVIGLGSFAVSIVAAYFLIEAMVGRMGLRSHGKEMFLPYIGMSILYILGVGVGLIAVVIPGLVIMARWSIAAPLLIAQGHGVTQALGESWERTRGAEFTIIVAALAVLIPLFAVVIACSLLFEPADLLGLGVSQLASSAASAVGQALGVALYMLILGANAVQQDPPL